MPSGRFVAQCGGSPAVRAGGRLVVKMPFSAALPGWMLFVMSPDSKKALRPAACVPARPSVSRTPSSRKVARRNGPASPADMTKAASL